MDALHVLSTADFNDEQLNRLRAVSPRLQIVQYTTRDAKEVPPDVWSEVDVLGTFSAFPLPEHAPGLRWVQVFSAGVEHALAHPFFRPEITLTNASGLHAANVAELVLTLMLTFAHRLPELLASQRRSEWPQGRFRLFTPQELRGATVGIVGYGSIGREVGRLSSGFGMRVLALKRTADRVDRGYAIPGVGDPEGVIPERLYRPDELRVMLAECDFVALAVPLTAATRNLIGQDELRSMKGSAFLINIARGGVVDEPILIQALREGWIAGAGLDVFAREPLPADSPLWRMENVILTPHIAGSTPYYNARAEDVFAQNLRRYLAGEPLLNQVDYERGY